MQAKAKRTGKVPKPKHVHPQAAIKHNALPVVSACPVVNKHV